MQFSILREFVDLSKTLNFTKSAKSLYISQPVLSKHIASLEDELGVKLFTRVSGNIALTKAGQVFVQDAVMILNDYESALRRLKKIEARGHQSIAIGYLYGASSHILLPALTAFSKTYPDTSFEIRAYELSDIMQPLENDEIDIAIASITDEDTNSLKDRYEIMQLYPDHIVLIAPPDHPLASQTSISLQDLEGEQVDITCHSALKSDYLDRLLEKTQSIIAPLPPNSIRAMPDVISLSLLLKHHGALYLTFDHLKNLFKDDFAFIRVRELDPIVLSVVALWKKSNDSKAIRDLSKCLKEAACRHYPQ